MTKTNIAIARRMPSLGVPVSDDIPRVSPLARARPPSGCGEIITGVKQGQLGSSPELHDLDAILPGDRKARRQMLVESGARIVATMVAMFALYAVLPIPGTSGAAALAGLIAGLLAFTVLVGWQIHSIVSARQPVLRAIEVVAFALPLLVVVFAYVYLWISQSDPGAFSEELDRIGAVYYAVSIVSTLGFGDISPITDGTRLVVTLQMLFDIALIAGFARLVIIAARTGLRRKRSED
jgi:voltage-gated potassium channel